MHIELLLKIQNDRDDFIEEEISKLSTKKYIKRLLSLGKEDLLIKVLQHSFILEKGSLFKSKRTAIESKDIPIEQLLNDAIDQQKIKTIAYLISKKNELDPQVINNVIHNSIRTVIDHGSIDCLRLLLSALTILDTQQRDSILTIYLRTAINSNRYEMVDVIVKAGGKHPELSSYYIKRFSTSVENESFNNVLSTIYEKITIKQLFNDVLDEYIKKEYINLNDFLAGDHDDYHKEFYQYCMQQIPHNKYLFIIKSLMDKGADFMNIFYFMQRKIIY